MKNSPGEEHIRRPGDETIEMVATGSNAALDKICALDESTAQNRRNKRQLLAVHIDFLERKMAECGSDKKNLKKLMQSYTRAREAHEALGKLIEHEKHRVKGVDGVRERFSQLLQSTDSLPDRGKRKGIYASMAADLKNKRLIGKAKPEEVEDLRLQAQEQFNALEAEDIDKELEHIRRADQDGQSPKVLKSRVDTLFVRAKAVSQELATEIEEVQKAIQQELDETDQRKKKLGAMVRRAASTMTVHIQNAKLETDVSKKSQLTIEAIKVLRAVVFKEGGGQDPEAIEILRDQFDKQADHAYRRFLLDWVLANPKVELTPRNFAQVMRDLPTGVPPQKDTRSPESKCRAILAERAEILEIEDEGRRLGRIIELLQEIQTMNGKDKAFAEKYGRELLTSTQQERDKLHQIAREMLKALGNSDRGQTDDSKALKQRLAANSNDASAMTDLSGMFRALSVTDPRISAVEPDSESAHESPRKTSGARRFAQIVLLSTSLAVLAIIKGGHQNGQEASPSAPAPVSTASVDTRTR